MNFVLKMRGKKRNLQLYVKIIAIMKIVCYYHYKVIDVQHCCVNPEENAGLP